MGGVIDLILIGIVAAVAWCVAGEGAFSAASTCLCVILAGLLAMNYFEPLIAVLPLPGRLSGLADVVALVGLFILLVLLFRFAAESVSPRFVDIQPLMYEVGRWGFGVLTGYVTMAFLLTALHTAPLPREFLGFTPERNNLLGLAAPDRQWLGFTQYVSEHVFRKGPTGKLFDGPRFVLGDSTHPHPNTVWPSFPIRYATRREGLSWGSAAAAPSGTGRKRLERTRSGNSGGGF